MVFSLLMLPCFVLLSLGGVEAAEPERIVVASGDGFEPLMFLNVDGEPDGVYAELWELWSEKTGVEVELRLMEWSQAIPALLAGRVDAVDGVSYTPERAEFLDFSLPHGDMQSYIFFHESIGAVRRLSDLAGFPVGVIKGSYQEDYLRKEAPEVRPVAFANYEEMVHAAIGDHLRAFVGEEPMISFLFAKHGRRVTFRRTEAPFFASDLHIAVRKGETELLSLIKRGQKSITEQECQQIWDAWSGVSLASQFPWRWLMLGAGGVFLVVVLLFILNAQLRRKIAKATQTLCESEELAKASLNATNDMVYLADADGNLLTVNDNAALNFNKTPEEMIGTNIFSYFPPDQARSRKEYGDMVIRSGKPICFQDERQGRSFNITIYPTFDSKGTVDRFAVFVTDITERKKAEDALQFLSNITEQVSDSVIATDLDYKITYTNDAFEKLYGYRGQEVLGRTPEMFNNSAEAKKIQKDIYKKVSVGQRWTGEYENIRKDGSKFICDMTIFPLADKQGQTIGYTGIQRDVTGARQAEAAMERQQYYLEKAQEMGSIGTWELDIEKNVLVWTDESYRIFGIPVGTELTYEIFLNCVHPDDRQYVDSQWKAAQSGKPYDIEHRIIASGEIKWVREKAELQFDDKGKCIRGTGFTQDITEHREVEEALKTSEEQFRLAVLESPFPIMIHADDGEVLQISKVWTELTGYTSEDIPTLSDWTERAYGERKEIIKSRIDKIFDYDKKVDEGEYFITSKDGNKLIWDFSSAPLGRLPDGRCLVISIAMDVTERRRMEETVQSIFKGMAQVTGEDYFKCLVKYLARATGFKYVLLGQLSGSKSDYIKTAAVWSGEDFGDNFKYDLAGTPCEQVVGQSFCIYPENIQQLFSGDKLLVEMGVESYCGIPLFDSDGKPLGVLALFDDKPMEGLSLTEPILKIFATRAAVEFERVHSEEERENLAKFPSENPNPVLRISKEGEIKYANEASRPVLETWERKVGQILPAECAKRITDVFRTGKVTNFEFECNNGSVFSVTLSPVEGTDYANAYGHDITDRRQSEKALRHSEERFRLFYERSPLSYQSLDSRGCFIEVNPAWLELLGYSKDEVQGRSFADFLVPDDKKLFKERFLRFKSAGKTRGSQFEMLKKDGSRVIVEIDGKIGYDADGRFKQAHCVLHDITARKQAEKEIQRYQAHLEDEVVKRTKHIHELERQRTESEKLAATGRMAARIAHEINNPLAAIKGSFAVMKSAVKKDHPRYKFMTLIDSEIDRIARIIRQMYSLYKPQAVNMQKSKVNRCIGQVISLLKTSTLERKVTIDFKEDRAAEHVELPDDMLRQVMYNLIQNAIDASDEGGVVRVNASRLDGSLTISVKDSGDGIPEDIQADIFEPFFTTKEDQTKSGLGMGLSVCKSLAEAMGGKIDFETNKGKGTTFNVVLPIIE
jgi:PAS domain S-box-containing protein